MPRERIQHGQMFVWPHVADSENGETEPVPPGMLESAGKPYTPGEPLSDGAVLREEPSLDLSWRREDVGGWVQIGFDAPRDWWERFFASYDNSPEQRHFSAWTAVMDRRQINHMIKTLRRARDAAYGSDE